MSNNAMGEAQRRRPYSGLLPNETYNAHYRDGFVDGATWRKGLRWEDPCPVDPQGHNCRGPYVCDHCGAVDVEGMWKQMDLDQQSISYLNTTIGDRDKTIKFLKDWLVDL